MPAAISAMLSTATCMHTSPSDQQQLRQAELRTCRLCLRASICFDREAISERRAAVSALCAGQQEHRSLAAVMLMLQVAALSATQLPRKLALPCTLHATGMLPCPALL